MFFVNKNTPGCFLGVLRFFHQGLWKVRTCSWLTISNMDPPTRVGEAMGTPGWCDVHPENWGRFPFWLIFFKGVGSTHQRKEISGLKLLVLNFLIKTLHGWKTPENGKNDLPFQTAKTHPGIVFSFPVFLKKEQELLQPRSEKKRSRCNRGHYITHLGGIKQYKSMAMLMEFPLLTMYCLGW